MRLRAREQLALGASQIKLMAGGGVASSYDPLDVTQYTVPELRAAVEAAENWGTYVTVHAYTPRAVRQAIEAGVKCIDHGQLLDEPTAKLMAEKGVWWSLQPFTRRRAVGVSGRLAEPQEAARDVRRHRHRLRPGQEVQDQDRVGHRHPVQRRERGAAGRARWPRWSAGTRPAEVLKMATADNAELLALSGLRSPYAGKLGVVEEGALADLLLVDGDPICRTSS